ncbi:type II toxin-antitoxin system MqsR family toxin [Dyella sp. 2RAB6]|uniref:type II toxin-antitoxin system MqsR family toxin n=1 Tax=Dyella sp. 2RAB6 TaxID=3232992 RepID=UPI003F93E487
MARHGKGPTNDLAEFQRLVKEGNFSVNKKSRLEADALEYSTDEIVDCLMSLKVEKHFDHNRTYDDGEGTADVYFVRWHHFCPSRDENVAHNLYIKLRINPSGRAALVLSFHPERNGKNAL